MIVTSNDIALQKEYSHFLFAMKKLEQRLKIFAILLKYQILVKLDKLYIWNVKLPDETLIQIFTACCNTLDIAGMTLSDNVSSSLGKCINNNITKLVLGDVFGGLVSFNFHLFSACVTDQSKCNKISCCWDTVNKYRGDFKLFCKQSHTWSVTHGHDSGYLEIKRK